MNNYGINIPVAPKGFCTAQQIVQEHISHLNSCGGVYFSTSDRIDPNKATDLDFLLLSNLSGLRYLCEIESYQYFEDPAVPKDSAMYSPQKYANVSEKHWFKLRSISAVGTNVTSNLIPLNKKVSARCGNVENYISTTGRLQVFYFEK